MASGWVKLHRSIFDNPIHSNYKYSWLWVVLLLMASHTDTSFLHGNTLINLKKGQFVTGRKQLATKSGIKEGTVETILNYLETQQQIKQQKTSRYRIITIVNWDRYQGTQQEKRQRNDNEITTKRQRNDTIKNDKNEKNDKKRTERKISTIPKFKENKDLIIKKFQDKYPEKDVEKCFNAVIEYCEMTGKRYKNYELVINNWLRDDDRNRYNKNSNTVGIKSKIAFN